MRDRRPFRTLLPLLLVPLVTACGSDAVTVPTGTRLTVELSTRVDPGSTPPGTEISARLAGNLAAEDRVLIPAGAVLRGRITAVQQADERLPAAVKLDFRLLETGNATDSLAARIVSAEARTPDDSDGTEGANGTETTRGLAGTVVEGREHAPLVGPELSEGRGTAVLLGTDARPAHLPEGARVELELTEPLEVEPPNSEE